MTAHSTHAPQSRCTSHPLRVARQYWSWIIAGALLCSLSPVAGASGEIYKCKADGVTTFSDTPCAIDAQAYQLDTSRVSTYAPVPSQARPSQATGKARSKQARSNTLRANSNGSIAADQARRAAECDRINESLREVRSKQRSGYSIREGEKLAARQAKLASKRRAARCP